jgi:hypothetical protein
VGKKNFKFKSQVQTDKNVLSAKGKDIQYKFCCDVLPRLEEQTVHSVMKPHSIYQEMLIATILIKQPNI